jgi:nucleoside-diphosphate-sugar epimerase
MSTTFLTGGSGFLGQHLIRQLRAAGHAVRALARSPASRARVEAAGAKPVDGDLDAAERLDDALTGVDAVFHAAADTSTWSRHNARQVAVNVDGSRALAEAALRAGVRHFLLTSSVSSFSHLVTGVLSEQRARRGLESWINYERSKAAGEDAVRAVAARGMGLTVLYPAHIFGPGDTHNWARLVVLIQRGKLPGAPPGAGSFADVREVARAHVEAYARDRRGESYLLGGEHARMLDLVQRIGRRLGRPTPARAMPAWLLRPYAWLAATWAGISGTTPEITPEAAAFTCMDLVVDSTKAMRELDYRQTPLDTLLDDTIAWMREQGALA